MRAEELCRIADRTGDARYAFEATRVHFGTVECRHPPLALTQEHEKGAT